MFLQKIKQLLIKKNEVEDNEDCITNNESYITNDALQASKEEIENYRNKIILSCLQVDEETYNNIINSDLNPYFQPNLYNLYIQYHYME